MRLKNYLVIQNSAAESTQFEIWTRAEYEKYISDTLDVGACPAVSIITDFNESDSLLRDTKSLEQKTESLYPHPEEGKYSRIDEDYLKDRADIQRSAHINAARQYMGEIEKLKAENAALIEEIQNWKDELKDQAREHKSNR